MNYVKIVMQEFKLNDDDLYYSVTKQLIDLYINMIIQKTSSEKIDRMLDEISNTSYFPSDSEMDSYYVFENLYYNYTMYNYSELKMTFKTFFRMLKDLRNREIYSYVNINGYAKDYYLEDELPSILRQPSKPLETFEEIDAIIRQARNDATNRDYLGECESSFVKLLNNTSGFITRQEIMEEVKYPTLVYKFLKPKYVIDFKGKYLDVREFHISEEIEDYMYEDIEYSLKENEIIHIDDLYKEFHDTYYDYFIENKIYTSYALYSVLEYLFSTSFVFSRPLISLNGKRLYTKDKMIESYIKANERLLVSDLYLYINRLKLSSSGLLVLLDNMNDLICLENKNTLLHWDKVHVEVETIEEVESLIFQEVSKKNAMAIVDLECAYWFPEIELDWDEWFIYCLIKKYSSRLYVEPSSRQFKIATPIISISDDLDEFELNYISEYKNNETIGKKEVYDIETIELENVEELLGLEEDEIYEF